MFDLIFGTIWTIFTCVVFLFLIPPTFTNPNGEPGIIFNTQMVVPFTMLSIFFIIGVYIIIRGTKKIIRNSKTNKHGSLCYGIVQDVQTTGSYINNQPEYKALIDVIIPGTARVEQIEEIVGFNYFKYPIHSYVICKYYEGDINFEKKISSDEVPDACKEYLKPINYKKNLNNPKGNHYTDLVFSEDREYVTIDGIRYKRVE